jgi:hypothetical protein
MERQDICQQLIDAVNAAIAANPDIAAAMKALEISGIELQSLHITANLRTTPVPMHQSDADFLHTLRITPDLEIRDDAKGR